MSPVGSIAVSVVVLTRGERPIELAKAVSSARNLATSPDEVEIVLVWNGAAVPDESPADLDVVFAQNLGIPEGRNRGLERCRHDLVVFLDDDAYFEPGQRLLDVVAPFDDPRVGAVGYRIADEHNRTARRHVPRLGGRNAAKAGEVTAFLGGAVAVRASAFREVGGYAGEFFYAMEETDLAWRLIDAGHRIWYLPGVVVRHPWTLPGRHTDALARTARNRVWLAHRNLPIPLALAYLTVWVTISIVRNLPSPVALRSILGGVRDGWRRRLGPRRPVRWATVWRLTRLGRPPIV